MKLEKPITIIHAKYTDPNTKKVVTPSPITIDELKIVYIDKPDTKQYYIAIDYIPTTIMLFENEDYENNPDITKSQARARLSELSEGDMQSYLQNTIPKTLEDEPYAPGSILASMFSSIGIKAGPQCSCKRHALEMNRKGIEWCENNMDTILGWLKEETEKRKLPWVETVARMVVNRALSKAKKYREEINAS